MSDEPEIKPISCPNCEATGKTLEALAEVLLVEWARDEYSEEDLVEAAKAIVAERDRFRSEMTRLKEIEVEDLKHRLYLVTKERDLLLSVLEERDRLKARLDLLRAMASEIRWERVVDFCVRERLVADGNLLSQLAKALRESEGDEKSANARGERE